MLKERKETPNFSLILFTILFILFIILYNRLFMFLLFQQKMRSKQEKLPPILMKLLKVYLIQVLLYPYTQGQQDLLLLPHFLEINSCFVTRYTTLLLDSLLLDYLKLNTLLLDSLLL